MKKIGFIGVGIMGKSMVRNLMKQGFELSIYARNPAKVQDVVSEGARLCDSVAACVAEQDVVITIVGMPADVEEVYFGTNGILANANAGCYLIDMTTTSPKIAQRIDAEASAKGMHALDAPVSGGDVGAKNGTLSIMVGGKQADFDACLPVFSAMGTNVNLVGAAGSGQHTKMANQIAIAGAISGVCEAMTYGKAAGLDLQKMLDCISAGACGSWQMSNMAPRILKGDLEPGFFIRHFIKDMAIADSEAADRELTLGVLQHALKMYRELDEKGLGEKGTQALIEYYK